MTPDKERKKDREEFHAWRRGMEAMQTQTQAHLDRFISEHDRLRREDREEYERQRRQDRAEQAERDRRIDGRIDKLVSAIGELVSRMPAA